MADKLQGIDSSTPLSLFWTHPIFSFFAILVPVLLFWTFGGKSSKKPRLPLPPGNLGWPLIGEPIQFLLALKKEDGFGQWFRARAARHGPIFKTHMLGSPVVLLDPPQGNKFLFQNEGVLLEHDWPAVLARLFGRDSLYVKVGDEHELARRPFSSFLDRKAVSGLIEGVERNVVHHFDRHWEGKGEVAAHQMTRTFTFAIICSLLFSPDGPELEHLNDLFRVWAAGAFSLEVNLPGFNFYYALKARRAILQVMDNCIAQRRRELAESGPKKLDVLTALLETGTYASDAELKDNLLLFLLAGYDTSSVALAMMILLIGRNRHVYDQLLEEHKAILEKKRAKGEDDGLKREDLAAMKYSWRVIQESLRLQAPVPGAFRKAVKDFEYNGYTIPKGWKVMWNNQLSHFNPNFFKDPFTFDPSRWEQEHCVSFTFLPFGAGARMCPGYEFAKMEMLVFLHHLVRRYDWTLCDPREPVLRDPMPRTPKEIPIRISGVTM